jgi:phytoene desaturase
MSQARIVLLMLLLCAFLLNVLISCDDDDDDDDDDDESDDDDSEGDDDVPVPVDTVTSASPGRDFTQLDDGHYGWLNAACYDCHVDNHLGAFFEGECSTCHGSNGATYRPTGHDNTGCYECHPQSHPGTDFAENHCTACHSYDPDELCPITEDYDVVVVGGGGGGLSAAAALAKEGMKVLVLEKHYHVGGYMNRFHRADYDFEISLHAIAGLGSENKNQDLVRLGIHDKLDPVPSDPFYVSYFPGDETYTVAADINTYREYLKTEFPHEAAGIDALFDEMALMDELLEAVTGLTGGFSLRDLMTLLSDPIATLRLARYVTMTLQDFMEQYLTDPKLIGFWSQLVIFLGDGPSDLQAVFFQAMWSSYHNQGYYYPIGGSGAITDAIVDVIKSNGGTIKVNSLVNKIVVENGRAVQVRTVDDGCYNAKYVVSNANAPDTLLKMVDPAHLPPAYVEEVKNLEICVPTTLQIYMGVDADYREYFQGTHELIVNESYDQDENFEYVYDGDPYRTSFIVANYSMVDPTVAPSGKNVMSMAAYLPMEWEDTWKWEQGYQPHLSFKENVAQIYIDRMEQYLPDLNDHIEVLEIGTPLTNRAFTLNPKGSIYGWRNTPEQATVLRLKQQTPIDNLILAGAWTFPGGGQATVIGSGCAAADMILEKEAAK